MDQIASPEQAARNSIDGRAFRMFRAMDRRNPPDFYHYGKRSSQKQDTPQEPSVSKADLGEVTTSAAQEMVLSTPELIVLILSQLPHSTLLQAKRVCTTWAGVFGHVEIQAALFMQPRPKGSALYVEDCSDILKSNFSTFWPADGFDHAWFAPNFDQKGFHRDDETEESSDDGVSNTKFTQHAQHIHQAKCPHSRQWRQLLVCQPPIHTLELVQRVCRLGAEALEFRTTITRPTGIRMGFLYDAVRHWHQVERSRARLLWNRKTGDLTYPEQIYEHGPSFKTADDMPCLTISGHSAVGCGQYGGLTIQNYLPKQRIQAIKSGREKVKYRMSEPKTVGYDGKMVLELLKKRRNKESGEAKNWTVN